MNPHTDSQAPDISSTNVQLPISQTSIENSQSTNTRNFGVKPAGAWPRFWANFIDSMVLSLPIVIVAFGWSLITKNNITLGNIENNNIFTIILLICYFPYYIYLTSAKGTTVGKDAYGLKVVKYGTQENLTYARVTLRELLKFGLMIIPFVGGLFYVVNGLIVLFSKQKRGIHDTVANSQVLIVKPAWTIGKQIVFFGGYILLGVVIFILKPQFLDDKPTRIQPIVKLEHAPENLTAYTDATLGWSISYDSLKFTSPIVFNKETLQHGASQPLPTTIQQAVLLTKSSVADFCTGKGGLGIDVEDNSQLLSVTDWFSQFPHKPFLGNIVSQKTLGENNAFVASLDNFAGVGSTKYTYIIPKDSSIYLLSYSITKAEKESFSPTECEANQQAIIRMFESFKIQ
jgi:uncharacterized RDD family membrane protein YckC